jgi:hypothetical protein
VSVAWSDYDAATGRYRLVVDRGDQPAPAPIAASRRAFDVSLGPDARGRVVALYTRCRTANHGCDVYRYDVGARTERKVAAVSSAAREEAWPVQWRDRLAFVRRDRTYAVMDKHSDHELRPDPRGKRGGGTLVQCDVPYVKTLSARAASRRLDRGSCAPTTGLSIRHDRIVQVTDVHEGPAGSETQVRVLRAGGGVARVLARSPGGEGGYSPFSSPNQSASAVWLTRTGVREGERTGFLRLDPALGTADGGQSERAAGRPSRPRRTRNVLVCPSARAAVGLPRRATVLHVRAAALPARPRVREPVLIGHAGAATATAALGRGLARHHGTLQRADRVVRRPHAGGRAQGHGGASRAAWRRLARAAAQRRARGPLAATGLTTTTDQTGHWSFSLMLPPSRAYFVAVAHAMAIASRPVGAEAGSR